MQWHLAAFKTAQHTGTAARTLALVASGGCLAHPRAHAASHALALLTPSVLCVDGGRTHDCPHRVSRIRSPRKILRLSRLATCLLLNELQPVLHLCNHAANSGSVR